MDRTFRHLAPPRPTTATASPALALRNQLEQSVQSLEGTLTKARTTLLALSNMEEAEANPRRGLRGGRRASGTRTYRAEERRRRVAENLAEAASSAAREAEQDAADAGPNWTEFKPTCSSCAPRWVVELEWLTQERILAAQQSAEEQIHSSHQQMTAAQEEA